MQTLGGRIFIPALGIPTPVQTLSDFIGRKVENLSRCCDPNEQRRLGLISGALDVLGAANPKYTQKA